MSTRKATPDIMGNVLAATAETWNGKELDYPLTKIKVGSRLRPINDAEVDGLVDSLRIIGLLNAIHLLPDGTLVAGNHRRAAAERLGWTHIRARIVELSEVDAELAEIDENLRRSNLTILEEAEHLLRREELLEAKGSRAKAGDNQHTAADDGGGATVAPPPTATTAGMAHGLGLSERSAQIRLQIARNLDSQAKDAIRGTDLATSTRQLVELARQPAEKQRTIADLIVRGEAGNVADAVRIIDPPPAPEPVKPTYWSPAPQAGGATVAPPPAEQKAYVSVDPWQVALDTPGSRQHRSEALAHAITPWILEYCDTYGRKWQDLARYGNPSHRLSTFWTDITKELNRRGVTVEDATLKEAIKQAFSWMPADAPAKAQPTAEPERHARTAAGTAVVNEIDKPLMEWTDEDWAKWQSASQAAVAAADESFGITADTAVQPAAGEASPGTTAPTGNGIVVPYLAAEWEEAKQRMHAGIDSILRPDATPVSFRPDYDSDEWYTPAEYIEAARLVMGSIDLDPASCELAQTVVQADVYLSKLENGLVQQWIRENVWINPPYGQAAPWMAKLLAEYDKGSFVKQAVVLLNNMTETNYFQSLLTRFPVCFPDQRIAFWRHDAQGVPGRQGQALFYLGPNVDKFAEVFGAFGPVLGRIR